MNYRLGRTFGRLGVALSLVMIPLLANAQQVMQVASVGAPQPKVEHEIDPALRIARESLQHIRTNVNDYTALFVKRCRVDGVLPPLQYSNLKIRNRKVVNGTLATPMSVYLDFLKPSDVKGREVIWVEGKNNGNLIAHQGGLARFVTVRLDPTGYLAMRNQRYPITEIGIENLLIKIIEAGEHDRNYGECDVQVFKNAKVGKITCTMVQVTHPIQRDHFDFHIARVFFSDNESLAWRVDD